MFPTGVLTSISRMVTVKLVVILIIIAIASLIMFTLCHSAWIPPLTILVVALVTIPRLLPVHFLI